MSKIIKWIFISAGAFTAACAAFMSIVAPHNIGNILSLAAGLFLVFYGFFGEKIVLMSQYGVKKFLRISVNCAIVFFALLIGFLAVYGQIDTADYTEDAVIVLGAGLKGENITLPLYYRLIKAEQYHKKNPGAMIVVSGGQGPGEDVSEASAMKKFLVSRGVPEDIIIEENKSESTRDNFEFSKKILDENVAGQYKICYITNTFHIYRSGEYAKAAGLNCTHIHARINWYSVPVNYIRECAAVLYKWVFVR